ncbi:hypothetical protein pb186bvf_010187 [Paramecium bursaria]
MAIRLDQIILKDQYNDYLKIQPYDYDDYAFFSYKNFQGGKNKSSFLYLQDHKQTLMKKYYDIYLKILEIKDISIKHIFYKFRWKDIYAVTQIFMFIDENRMKIQNYNNYEH